MCVCALTSNPPGQPVVRMVVTLPWLDTPLSLPAVCVHFLSDVCRAWRTLRSGVGWDVVLPHQSVTSSLGTTLPGKERRQREAKRIYLAILECFHPPVMWWSSGLTRPVLHPPRYFGHHSGSCCLCGFILNVRCYDIIGTCGAAGVGRLRLTTASLHTHPSHSSMRLVILYPLRS